MRPRKRRKQIYLPKSHYGCFRCASIWANAASHDEKIKISLVSEFAL